MQGTKGGSCNSLVNIGSGPIEEFARKSIETCCGILQIGSFPNGAGIGPSLIHSSIAVITIIIARKGDIVRIDKIPFDFDLQCGVIRPTEAKKARHEVLRALQYTVLGCGSGNDLGRSIVEMSIVIVVEHAGVKEFLLPNRDQNLISKAIVEIV